MRHSCAYLSHRSFPRPEVGVRQCFFLLDLAGTAMLKRAHSVIELTDEKQVQKPAKKKKKIVHLQWSN